MFATLCLVKPICVSIQSTARCLCLVGITFIPLKSSDKYSISNVEEMSDAAVLSTPYEIPNCVVITAFN